ncbi:TGFB1 factor, partial [Podargus strigoides]|nr:TGFB1 factor [Podargus strigoides]
GLGGGCVGFWGEPPMIWGGPAQGYGNASWRYLHGRSVRVTADEEWLWFDVTDVVQQWLGGSDPLGMFKLSVHCPCEGAPEDMRVTIEGTTGVWGGVPLFCGVWGVTP